MVRIRANSPAKLNLSLGVGPLRTDGFHELITVFTALDLADEIVAEPADGAELILQGQYAAELTRSVERPGSTSPTTSTPLAVPKAEAASNLAIRAAEALARQADITADVRLTVTKRIPVAAGLAGGSTDAAAALIACDALWGLNTPRRVLVELAAELGSDVPFCLLGGVAVGTGRGELLRPMTSPGPFHWVLLPSTGSLSTPAVYGELDRLRAIDEAPVSADQAVRCQSVADAVAAADPIGLAEAIYNDLQPAAISLQPSLMATLNTGEAAGALAGIVCGSGPTCAFLARDEEHAAEVARTLAVSQASNGGVRPIVVSSGGPGVHLCL